MDSKYSYSYFDELKVFLSAMEGKFLPALPIAKFLKSNQNSEECMLDIVSGALV